MKKQPKKMTWKQMKREGYIELYLMMIPVLVILIIFKYIPMNGILIAFQDFNIFKGILGSEFIGFQNFQTMFTDRDFLRAIRNTFAINLYKMCFYIPLPIVLALLLNEVGKKFRNTMQTVVYLPHFLSWVIVGGI